MDLKRLVNMAHTVGIPLWPGKQQYAHVAMINVNGTITDSAMGDGEM